jgi:hypothetical protein
MMIILRAFVLGVTLAGSMAAVAQWQWIDKDGRKVFSDRAPPSETPEKNILKQPGIRGAPSGMSTAVAPAEPASAPRITGKDKELEEKKKRAETAETARKKAEDEKQALARADTCARAKRAKATFDSGLRVARTNDKGEREFMDDSTRAAETRRLQDIIEKDCK